MALRSFCGQGFAVVAKYLDVPTKDAQRRYHNCRGPDVDSRSKNALDRDGARTMLLDCIDRAKRLVAVAGIVEGIKPSAERR